MSKRIRMGRNGMDRAAKNLHPDAPLMFPDHPLPRSRRDFIRQGLMSGGAAVMGTSIFSLFASPRAAALSPDLVPLLSECGIATQGAGKIPFICFDLAGGANIAGSNVLVGKQGGQRDFISTAGYSKLGLPGDMIPPVIDPTTNADHIDERLGLLFHTDSAFLRGMLTTMSAEAMALTNGAIIAARSENDTGNNPHNPMYAINKIGADGSLLTLIGSQSSDSGGNSMAPIAMIDPSKRPTKVDRPSDVTSLVDVGDLSSLLGSQADAVAVMESIYRISDRKMGRVSTGLPMSGSEMTDEVVKDLVRCGYLKSADLAERFGNPATLDPSQDPDINGGIFASADFASDGELRKTAAIMKLVVNGFAGAGTITMGGFDYHTGDRATGERRDFRAGVCMGACLEYAHRVGVPLFLYVFSDGSLASNGVLDMSAEGRGKGQWTGDNQSTAASFFLVYNPNGRATPIGGTPDEQARRQQIGYYRDSGDVETSSSPAANNVNLLVELVALNYMALHSEQGQFATVFPGQGLGSSAARDALLAFQPICNGTISNPV